MPKPPHVNLIKQVKVNGKWRPATVLFDRKGRVRPDRVRVNGQDEAHPEGSYFIEWWDQGKRRREAAGANAQDAADKARVREAELTAARYGVIPPAPVIDAPPPRVTLPAALDGYLDYVRDHRSLRTFRTYRPMLASFKACCPKPYVDQVERQDLLDFATQLMKQGQKGKSIYNKLVVLSQVMKEHGKPKLLHAGDWPSFVETVRPIYEDAELTTLFKACTFPEEVRFKFYLMTGFRDAEGRFATWRDVDFKHTAVRVTAKPHWGFHPKNWEEREVSTGDGECRRSPVPEHIRPDGSILEKLKAVAYRAKLNCGHCSLTHVRHAASAGRDRHPDTAAVDGHRDLASTMVYLKGARNRDVQARINAGSLASFA